MTEIEIRRDIPFTDGAAADAYLPAGPGPHPALLAIHGGAWQRGDKSFYAHMGPHFARRGIAVFAINYRLTTAAAPSYPQTPRDVLAALAYLKREAAGLRIDPARVGAIGDSAGAHLASLAALDGAAYAAGAEFVQPKLCVGIYGVYDMAAQWLHDQIHRAGDNIAQKFLGAALYEDRRRFFDASPLSHAITARNQTPFFLAWGTEDDIVDCETQSKAFLTALKQAGFFVRTFVLPGAPHFWASDPLDAGTGYAARFVAALEPFLRERL
ncbi:MAG TPA: alpha/beta hydrolase [Burkholderiales bacterium]|jgi:acetyl esterase/lipase